MHDPVTYIDQCHCGSVHVISPSPSDPSSVDQSAFIFNFLVLLHLLLSLVFDLFHKVKVLAAFQGKGRPM